jgi:hypothetical protein
MSSDNPNLAIIAKNRIRRAVYSRRRESGLMGAFLIANFGIPEFLRSIPEDSSCGSVPPG